VGNDSTLMSVAISPGSQFSAWAAKAYGRVPERTYGAITPDGKRVLAPFTDMVGPKAVWRVVGFRCEVGGACWVG